VHKTEASAAQSRFSTYNCRYQLRENIQKLHS